jgi:adenine-specific DNA-methyltransferase
LCRTLLSDSGAIFIQIGEDNLHRVRGVVDEVFGGANIITTILVKKKGGQKGSLLEGVNDYIIFAAKNLENFAPCYRKITEPLTVDNDLVTTFRLVELQTGETLSLTQLAQRLDADDPARDDPVTLLNKFPGARLFTSENTTAGGIRKNQSVEFEFNGRMFDPGLVKGNCWKHTATGESGKRPGMRRVADAGRLYVGDRQIRFRRYHDDFGQKELTAWWDNLGGAPDPIYVVQTNPTILERCILMSTKPGDLVLDPTCGSGTTAYVAEQLGRRWITIDTSRIAVALTRQRLLTAQFDYYELVDQDRGVDGGIRYKAVPRISSGVVANCEALDPIFAKHEPVLDKVLAACNDALAKVSADLKTKLATKLIMKQKRGGRRAVTDADRRRWLLPPANRDDETKRTVDPKFRGWYHWEVPFDVDPDWPKPLQDAVNGYRAAWRAKMDEVNACIRANAEQAELVSQPEVRSGIVRVSGPFTVEAVQPQELSLDDVDSPIGGEPESDGETFNTGTKRQEIDEGPAPAYLGTGSIDIAMPAGTGPNREAEAKNADTYIDNMIRRLRLDGVRFPDNKEMKFSRLNPMSTRSATIHADGRWLRPGETDPDPEGRASVCVAFGPQYGPVTAAQVEILIRAASRRGFDDLLIAGFAYDGPAQTIIDEADPPHVRIHMAHIRPDVNPAMDGLLKETPGSQLFSVFGRPRTELHGPAKDGTYTVSMEGVDIYDPVTNTIDANRADKVAAWFVDSDYDGRTFCITQAFFPDKSAWEKLAASLKGAVDETAFAALAGTVSLPFPAGKHKTVAVKVIDPRGNEAMRVQRLS